MIAPVDSCTILDALCVQLVLARDRVVLPLARVVAAFVGQSAWHVFGYARASDFTRERLHRSSRWLGDIAALHQAFGSLPALEAALCGDDGKERIGRCAALLIGRIATPESIDTWIDFARSNTVRSVRNEVHRARRSHSVWPGSASDRAASGHDHAPATDGHEDAPTNGAARATGCHDVAPESEAASGCQNARDDGASSTDPAPPDDPELQDDLREAVKVAVPCAVLAAFEEALDLHRAVIGRESSVTGFIEALSAESAAGLPPADEVDVRPVSRGRERRAHEEALARATQLWKHLGQVTSSTATTRHDSATRPASDARSDAQSGTQSNAQSDSQSEFRSDAQSDAHTEAAREAFAALSELEELTAVAGHGDHAQLLEQMLALLDIEECLEIALGKALAAIGDGGSWRTLRFAGVGHYGAERLGMCRTTVEDRAGLARWLRTRPNVRSAYEDGRLGLESALLVRRVLERVPSNQQLESAWLERATQVTVKRLRDEVRLTRRTHLLGPQAAHLDAANGPAPPDLSTVSLGAAGVLSVSSAGRPQHTQLADRDAPLPIDDRAWQHALQRAHGDANERVIRLGIIALEKPIPDVFLRLRLPDDVAQSFVGALESKRREMADQAAHDTWKRDWEDPPWETTNARDARAAGCRDDHERGPENDSEDDPENASDIRRPAWLAARLFASRGRRVPTWVALLAMLEEYASTWDQRNGVPRRAAAAVYIRAGWRCTAPGCTSRQNLEDHHIVYRSRGGGHGLANRTCVCRFHHQQGEHGGLAACRGQAPLDIIWRLGRPDLAHWYRNERLLAPVPGRRTVDAGSVGQEPNRRGPDAHALRQPRLLSSFT